MENNKMYDTKTHNHTENDIVKKASSKNTQWNYSKIPWCDKIAQDEW